LRFRLQLLLLRFRLRLLSHAKAPSVNTGAAGFATAVRNSLTSLCGGRHGTEQANRAATVRGGRRRLGRRQRHLADGIGATRCAASGGTGAFGAPP
jgi:hypothetical protein